MVIKEKRDPFIATLTRIAQNKYGTFSALTLQGEAFCIALELPWHDNLRNFSCIPTGSYICKRIYSPRFRETFVLRDVPNRSHILFHKGNTTKDTSGCILLGQRFGEHMILGSQKAFEAFLIALKDRETFVLNVLVADKNAPLRHDYLKTL